MLYDILFIDDDFGEARNAEMWAENAQRLFLELIRDNVRVTYTTGEIDDLEKLTHKDLSTIQYIFCDLHLAGIAEINSEKQIANKLANIFDTLSVYIKSKFVTVFINSRYTPEWEKVHGVLKVQLKTEKKYTFEVVSKKNVLSDPKKQKLIRHTLNIYQKSLIINACLETETILDEKLSYSENSRKKKTFDKKLRKLKSSYKISDDTWKQLQLLQKIRNKLAHTVSKLEEIPNTGMRKAFWKIITNNTNKQKTDAIAFENFAGLITYLESIRTLGNTLNTLDAKP